MIAEYLKSKGMRCNELARRTDCTPKHISEVLNGKARVTIDFALKLEYVLGRPAHFWTNIQQLWDLEKARSLPPRTKNLGAEHD
jgi:addiction module HigA family antidote